MRAAVLHGPRDLRFEERPEPKPGPGEVSVEIRCSGICGTDLHQYVRPYGASFRPTVLGHDFAGVVRLVGGEVAGFAPGDRVTIEPSRRCGQCNACRVGAEQLCRSKTYMGMGMDGCLQDVVVANQEYVHRLPESVSDEMATVLEPVAVALHVFDRRVPDRRGDETVVAIGSGPIGLVTIQDAKRRGHPTVAVDLVPERLALASQFGADATVDASLPDAADRIRELSGDWPNILIDSAGNAASARLAFESASWLGRIVFVTVTGEPVPIMPLLLNEVTATGSRGGYGAYPESIRLLNERRILVEPMITHRFPFAQLESSFELLLGSPSEAIRVVIEHHPDHGE